MAVDKNQLKQVEGKWDELLKLSDQFAGRRVRVTVLPDEEATEPSAQSEIRHWLAEGDKLEITPPAIAASDAFGDALIEKFRKQGLVF
jgi:hypothetical protein